VADGLETEKVCRSQNNLDTYYVFFNSLLVSSSAHSLATCSLSLFCHFRGDIEHLFVN
jgi:hypothetical protein